MIVLGLLSSFFESLGLSLFIPLLHTLGGGEFVGVGQSVGRLHDVRQMVLASVPGQLSTVSIVAAITAMVILKNLVAYANDAAFAFTSTHIGHDLRVQVFERVVTMPLARTESERSGKLLNVLHGETWRTIEALTVLSGAITSLCTVIVFVPLLLLLSWQLTVIALVCTSLVPGVIGFMTRHVRELGERAVAANDTMTARMWASFSGLRVVHSFGRELFESNRFAAASLAVRDTFYRLRLASAASGPVSEILLVAVIAVVALTVKVGLIDLPTLIAFVAILYRLQPRIRSLFSSRVTLLGLQGAVLAVTDFLDAPPDPARGLGTRIFSGLNREIRFERATFRYDGAQRAALDDVSFTIRRGGMIAVVGRSGAGKSTLLDLLLQFRRPQQGMILVDGVPLEALDVASWRSRIAVVSQDPYIFDDTIRDNILYGRPAATDTEIADAACLAHADHFIAELPRGYETVVGDRGVRLSGGQRQRLALARALVRRPDILVLDEATNALDSLTERAFQEALAEFARERTVIVVAHRLSTIERAEHIVVLAGQLWLPIAG